MPKKKSINLENLIQAVESKTPAKKIMEKFDIKTSAQLKALYLDALTAVGRVKAISKRESPGKRRGDGSRRILVNKRGSLVFPKQMVDEFGFKIDQVFTVVKTRTGVSVKKAQQR